MPIVMPRIVLDLRFIQTWKERIPVVDSLSRPRKDNVTRLSYFREVKGTEWSGPPYLWLGVVPSDHPLDAASGHD
jgi:hypothetical protein